MDRVVADKEIVQNRINNGAHLYKIAAEYGLGKVLFDMALKKAGINKKPRKVKEKKAPPAVAAPAEACVCRCNPALQLATAEVVYRIATLLRPGVADVLLPFIPKQALLPLRDAAEGAACGG